MQATLQVLKLTEKLLTWQHVQARSTCMCRHDSIDTAIVAVLENALK